MTLLEALATAAQATPNQRHRHPLDKLQASTGAGQIAADAAALSKRFYGMADALSSLQKRVDQIAADVEYLENFKPGSSPRRTLQ